MLAYTREPRPSAIGKGGASRALKMHVSDRGLYPPYLLPPPTLGKRCHRSLARRLIAVCGCAVLVVPRGQRPHPRRSTADPDFKDAADNFAIGNHVVVVIAPFARLAIKRRAFQEQVIFVYRGLILFLPPGTN
jgi:hypothetical protein